MILSFASAKQTKFGLQPPEIIYSNPKKSAILGAGEF